MINIEEALDRVRNTLSNGLVSPNEFDSNLEPANVTDGLYFIGRAIYELAEAIKNNKKGS